MLLPCEQSRERIYRILSDNYDIKVLYDVDFIMDATYACHDMTNQLRWGTSP